MTAKDMIDAINAVNVEDIAAESVDAVADDYLDANREQMMRGLRRDGEKISSLPGNPYRNKYYERKKNAMNPKAGTGNPDLRLTGDFQNSLTLNIESDDIYVYSFDDKNEKLEEHYGDQIFGLSEASKQQLIDKSLQAALVTKIAAALGQSV